MGLVEKRAYWREPVAVDGNHFVECHFQQCTIQYSGGAVPAFADCSFDACTFELDGAARLTLEYLTMLNGAGADSVVAGWIGEIQCGRHAGSG
jgi:hypothetical protein